MKEEEVAAETKNQSKEDVELAKMMGTTGR